MGSEVSTESGKNRNLIRTNSLKDVNIEDSTECRRETKKPGKPVRRSNTFSGLSGTRPNVTRRSKKKNQQTLDENRDMYITEDVCIDITGGIDLDFNPEKCRIDNHKNDEDLFIPTKKNFGSTESSSAPSQTKVSSLSTEVLNDSEENGCEKRISSESDQQNSTGIEGELSTDSTGRLRTPDGTLEDGLSCRYKKRSKDEVDAIFANTNDMEYANVGLKPTDKRRKPSRSRSLSCSDECATDEKDIKHGADATANKNLEGSTRRTSDSYLLREQHVKKSEQFSAMIKQIRESRMPKRQQLSSYALGAIAASHSNPQSPLSTAKHLKQNDYFDSWIKDQSERINNLAEALRGDEFKVNELRLSFRGRALETKRWEMLPSRPKSDKLPRRRRHMSQTKKYISSDTEDELDNKIFAEVDYGNTKPRTQDGAILTKQLSETFLLLDNSFENSKKDLSRNEISSGSSRSSVSYRMSNSTFSDYGLLEERPDSVNEGDVPINIESLYGIL